MIAAILCCMAVAAPLAAAQTSSVANAPANVPIAVTADGPVRSISLEAATAAAADGNYSVLNARLAVRTAEANRRIADTSPNPIVSVNALQIRPGSVGSLPYTRLADTIVRADLPLEMGGKRRARVGAALASIDAAEGDLDDARRQMRVAVANAFFTLKAAEQRLAVQRAIATSYGEAIRIASRQQRAGALSESDLVRQRVEALRASTDAEQANADRRDAQLALATLIGAEPDATRLATIGAWPLPVGPSGASADLLAQRRADVRAANARVEAARRNLDGAHALRHPDITVGAQFERADGDVGVGRSVGFGIAIPLPVRNRYRGEVDAAGVALVQAEAQARKTLAVATAEIETARQAMADATRRRTLIVDTQLPAARRAAEIAEFAYAHGAMTLLDVLDARRSLQAVQLGVIDAQSDEANAGARLSAAETTGTN